MIVQCKKNTVGTDSSNDLIDEEITLTCKINGVNFEGEEYVGYSIDPSYINYFNITAIDTISGTEIFLSDFMLSNGGFPGFRVSSLRFNGVDYQLLITQSYQLIITELTDSQIEGNFYGSYYSISNSDTILVSNGYFNIKPELPNDFYLSCNIGDNYFETNYGKDNCTRNIKKFKAYSNNFEKYHAVILYFHVGSISGDYVKKFVLSDDRWYVVADIQVVVDSLSEGVFYSGELGFIDILSMASITYYDSLSGQSEVRHEVNEASFEFSAVNLNGEEIVVTEGKYSKDGFGNK